MNGIFAVRFKRISKGFCAELLCYGCCSVRLRLDEAFKLRLDKDSIFWVETEMFVRLISKVEGMRLAIVSCDCRENLGS